MSDSPPDVFAFQWMRQLATDKLARRCRPSPVGAAPAEGAHVFLSVEIDGQRYQGIVAGRELFLTLPGDAGGQLGATVITTESGQVEAGDRSWWLAKQRAGGALSLRHMMVGLSEAGCRALAHTFGLPILPLMPRAHQGTLKPTQFFYLSPAFAALRSWAALQAPGTVPAALADDPLGDWAAAALRPARAGPSTPSKRSRHAPAPPAYVGGIQTLGDYVKEDYALIDNETGRVCWSGRAASPRLACDMADRAIGRVQVGNSQYEERQVLPAGEPGYVVHYAPAGFDLADASACAALRARPVTHAVSRLVRLR